MSELRRYPDYKDSGVPWLGEIPSHWEVIDNKFIFNFSRGLTITKSNLVDEGIPCINYGEVHSKYGFEVDPKIHKLKCVPKEYVEKFDYALLNRGDFIFADTSEDYKGSGNFTYLNSDELTFAGYHTVVARLKTDDNPRFMAYLFDSNEFRTQVKTRVSGVKVFSITHNILKNVSVWIPAKVEQQAIVDFLDTELKQIDTLIVKQQQLIEKLAEQRSAVITHAVTKGLDLDVPMKDSGIEWLGDMPEHWKATKLKYYFDIQLGKMLQPNPSLSDDFEVNYLKAMHVQWDDTKVIDLPKMWCNERELEKYQVYDGDLLVCEGGEVGRSALIRGLEGTTIIQNALHRLRSTDAGDVRYLDYVIRHIADSEWFSILCNKATIAHLTGDKLANTFITLPPLSEQLDIIDHLDSQTKKIDEMSDSNKSIIAKLQEYRSALITQAVTGKIDVRHINKKAS